MAKDKDKKRREEQEALIRQLQQLMLNNYLMSFAIHGVKDAIKNGNDGFFFAHDDTANKAINRQLSKMAKQMDGVLLNGIKRSWVQGEESFIDKVKLALSSTAREQKALDKVRIAVTDAHREKAAKTFYNEKRNGLNISERVWNLANNSKKEIEIIIQNGIKEGKSADAIQKSLKGYLNEPEKLFRRVRNKETDKLEWSKAAQKYNPGRGVYRSAYKNAMRLARTETNAAYRTAEWQQYQNDPTIIGFKITLSNHHTTLMNGKDIPLHDICDELQGDYPKTFKWTGWHPQCRCEMYPIAYSRDDRKAYFKALFDGTADKWKPQNTAKEPPKAFNDWVEQNQERAKGWSNMPYFVRDNAKFVKTKFDVNTYTNEEKKFTQAHKTQESMQRVLDKLAKLYPNIPNTELAAIHHYTKGGGNYRQLNKQMDKDTLTGFNQAAQVLIGQGLEKTPIFAGNVYRGMIIKRKEFDRIFNDASGIIRQNRFVSSSMDADIGLRFATHSALGKNEISVFMEIKSKTGRDISRISEFNGNFVSDNQKEVIFSNNTPFKIVSKEVDSDGTVWLKMIEQ